MRNLVTIAVVACASFATGICAQTTTMPDLPTLLSGQKNLTQYYALIQKYPNIMLKLPSSNGITILAPSDDAFNKIPYTSLNEAFQNNDETVITNILEYHILQGQRMAADLIPGTPVFIATLLTDPSYTNVTGGQMVGNVKQAGDVVVLTSGQGSRSTVVIKDLSFTGGVVQVIDSLLVPPTGFPETAQAFNFTSYEGATYATNKTDNITYTKDLTLLVPQNQAFLALGPAISSMTSDQLAQVVDYSIIPELLYSTSLTNGSHFKTLQGGNITILHVGNNMYINSAQVLTTDILIANGVIHVIDNVLNPQGPGAQPNPVIPSQAPVFASASQVNSIPFTSALPCTTNCPITSTSAASASGTAGVSGASGAGATSTTSVSTRTSSGRAAAMAQETGLRAAGLMAAIGGAVFMI